MTHRLKILPAFFDAIERGEKKFEIRDNTDRGFQRGDTIELLEYDPRKGLTEREHYTGNGLLAQITYVSDYNQPPNQVVMAFSLMDA